MSYEKAGPTTQLVKHFSCEVMFTDKDPALIFSIISSCFAVMTLARCTIAETCQTNNFGSWHLVNNN